MKFMSLNCPEPDRATTPRKTAKGVESTAIVAVSANSTTSIPLHQEASGQFATSATSISTLIPSKGNAHHVQRAPAVTGAARPRYQKEDIGGTLALTEKTSWSPAHPDAAVVVSGAPMVPIHANRLRCKPRTIQLKFSVCPG